MKPFVFQKFNAIGLFKAGGISNLRVFDHQITDFRPNDLLVRVKSISVNPIDSKKRKIGKPNICEKDPLILGYDASGVIEEIGSQVKTFKKGDEVFYAGDISRNGSNSHFQSIDHRLVSLKPKNLSFSEAAALPLVSITAWESMIENMKISKNLSSEKSQSILIISGGGGVGSIAISIAKKVLGLKVIATGSRKESSDYCISRGADHVITYKGLLKENLENIGIKSVDYVFNCSDMTLDYFNQIPEICNPCGAVAWIAGLREPMTLNLANYVLKRISLHPEFMFARSSLGWEMEKQGQILEEMKKLVEKGEIQSNMKVLKKFSLETLKEGHEGVESGKNIGKFVLEEVDKYFERIH